MTRAEAFAAIDLERDGETLATELIQVAAIAVAWLEGDTCTF
jgi:hypothetical protein